MMLCRCDVCKKETSSFMQIVVSRNPVGGQSYAPPHSEHFDVCSVKCETEVMGKLLARLVPVSRSES